MPLTNDLFCGNGPHDAKSRRSQLSFREAVHIIIYL